jgi:glycosyltransferase involved in cell wall biosynthesis
MKKNLLMISGDRALAQGKRGAFYNTLQQLHEHWDSIHVITPSIRKHVSTIFFGNVYVHASPWPLILQPWFILKKGLQLHRQGMFDMMTVHEYPPFYNGIGARLLHNKTKIPYILEVMHFPGVPHAENLKEFLYHWLMRLFFRFEIGAAKRVRVINQRQTPEYLKKSGVPENKLLYIPAFYIDLAIFKPLDIEKKFDVMFAGRLVSNKGIFLFLDAVRQLPGARAIIVGDGPEKEKIEVYLDRHNLKDRVDLRGWAPDATAVAEIMNQSKLLIMPSYNEGGPRVVLEAMACGVPVLATSVGIVLDVIHHGDSGLIIPWDAKKIAATVKEALTDTSRYKHMRTRGLGIVQQFERSRSIQEYATKVQELI